MKSLATLLITLLVGSFGYSQEKECIKVRWIAVSNDSTNNHLFDSTNSKIDSLPIFQEIRSLVEAKKIRLSHGESGLGQSNDRYIDYFAIDECWNEGLDSSRRFNPYFEMSVESDIPLVDEYGDPIIAAMPDGTQYFSYPPPTIYQLDLGYLYELRVKETNLNGTFVPVEVAFCIQSRKSIKEIFWINLESALKATENEAFKQWVGDIQNGNFTGFQFKQMRCSDEFVR